MVQKNRNPWGVFVNAIKNVWVLEKKLDREGEFPYQPTYNWPIKNKSTVCNFLTS